MPTEQLPGMPPEIDDTPLGRTARKFVEAKERLANVKLDIEELEKDILVEMKSANQPKFKVSVDGENYEFELLNSEEHLRCAKITKQPARKDKTEEAVPA